MTRFAIPIAGGILTMHFGHAKEFAIIDVDGKTIQNKEIMNPPPHAPGVLPKWLYELGVNVIIAGGMGAQAIQLFAESGIHVQTGAPTLAPETLVEHYVNRTLLTASNTCDTKGCGH
ncbi:MAG: NifB/NifX family molybdenum-iron cluster-binding protein [Desulfosalsimonadaceae bacterium]